MNYQVPGVFETPFAGFWLRFVAYVIDWVITVIGSAIIGGILGFVIGLLLAATIHQHSATTIASAVGQLAGTVASWLYFTLMESSRLQATVGKMAVGIVVTDESGGRIGFGRATGRCFAKILSVIILCVGFMMAGWTQRKQALHDMIAGTLVVRKRVR